MPGMMGQDGINRQSMEDFQGSETTLYDTIMEDTCHYMFVQTHRIKTPRVNSNVNYDYE